MKRTTIAAFVSLISLSAAIEQPAVAAGGTDGQVLKHGVTWTYGLTGSFHYPEGANAHEFWYRLGKGLGER